MLTENDFVVTRRISSKTGVIEFKSIFKRGFIQHVKPNERLDEEIEKTIQDNIHQLWNDKLFKEIKDSLEDLRHKVMHEQDSDSSLGSDLANIINLCQIQPHDK